MTTKTFPKLYKIRSKEAIQEWEVSVDHQQDYSEIRVVFGQLDGAKQEKITKITKGKNLDKLNKTDHITQSESEGLSKWNKQIERKGYRKTIKEAKESAEVKIAPMLAKVYADHKHKIKFPCYIQPKLDGMRALTYYDADLDKIVMLSRQNTEIETTQHIKDELSRLFKNHPDFVLDGELYQHGVEFQSIISRAKRDEANDESKELEYWVYDCFSKNENLEFMERFVLLIHSDIDLCKYTYIVETLRCWNEDEIFKYHVEFLKDGYEGSMVRGRNAPYKIDGRSE